jgi:hydrogenase maturation protease
VRDALPEAARDALVIAVGNRFRRDDAAAFAVAQGLRAAGVDVLEAEGEPVELLDLWQGAREVVVIDAVSTGAPPGTIHRLDAGEGPLPADLGVASTHALGLAEAIELARALGRLPERLLVIGIEGADFSAGEGLTPAVALAAERVAREIR